MKTDKRSARYVGKVNRAQRVENRNAIVCSFTDHMHGSLIKRYGNATTNTRLDDFCGVRWKAGPEAFDGVKLDIVRTRVQYLLVWWWDK